MKIGQNSSLRSVIFFIGVVSLSASTLASNQEHSNRPIRIRFTLKQKDKNGEEKTWSKTITSDNAFRDCFLLSGSNTYRGIINSRDGSGSVERTGGLQNGFFNLKSNLNAKFDTEKDRNFLISCKTVEEKKVFDFGASLKAAFKESNSMNPLARPQADSPYVPVIETGNFDGTVTPKDIALKDETFQKDSSMVQGPPLYQWPPMHPTDEVTFIKINEKQMSTPRLYPVSGLASSKVTLGLLCGMAVFVFIQASLVIAVRVISARRSQRRKRIEIEVSQCVELAKGFDFDASCSNV